MSVSRTGVARTSRTPLPKVPAWVSEQGLTLTAKVAFTLNAEGLLTGVRIAQGSGYSDVDAAVVDAVLAAQTGLKLGDRFRLRAAQLEPGDLVTALVLLG